MKDLAKLIYALALVCLCAGAAAAQAGPRTTETPKATYPVPPPAEQSEPAAKVEQDAQNTKVYRCLDKGIALDPTRAAAANEAVFSSKEVDSKAWIVTKPQPAYTREARSNGTSGRVALRILLSASAKVTSVEVIKELPDGLTESAVKAACAISFEPAMKDGHEVSQRVIVEYGFMIDHRYSPGIRRLPLPPWP